MFHLWNKGELHQGNVLSFLGPTLGCFAHEWYGFGALDPWYFSKLLPWISLYGRLSPTSLISPEMCALWTDPQISVAYDNRVWISVKPHVHCVWLPCCFMSSSLQDPRYPGRDYLECGWWQREKITAKHKLVLNFWMNEIHITSHTPLAEQVSWPSMTSVAWESRIFSQEGQTDVGKL